MKLNSKRVMLITFTLHCNILIVLFAIRLFTIRLFAIRLFAIRL
jgi:hypothetical protein